MTTAATAPAFDVVVPTIGRPCLATLLERITEELVSPSSVAGLGRVVIVDDRAPGAAAAPLEELIPGPLAGRVTRGASHGRGPAAARNVGWRAADAPWVCFVDDDVVPVEGWGRALVRDLSVARPEVGGVQGRVHVPLPIDRPPTDWERDVGGLQSARWITADMAYRRVALDDVGGFDEGFPRAYREDADLALRVRAQGWRLVTGERVVEHPVRPAPWWISITRQRGNADDVRLRARHGRTWRSQIGETRGRSHRHVATVASAGLALAGWSTRRRGWAALGAAAWVVQTAQFAQARIVPGPKSAPEIATMIVTSIAIPPVAIAHRLAGWARVAHVSRSTAEPPAAPHLPLAPSAPIAPIASRARRPFDAVLFDRDGTLVHNVHYNGDPAAVRLMPGAGEATLLLRQAGVATAIVSNQSGVGRGLITTDDVHRVNARVDELAGPFDLCLCCFHDASDACDCRKPAPGLVFEAARRLGVAPARCAVIGDIGADVEAAARAGATGILVPNGETRVDEIVAAPVVAPTLIDAVHFALGLHRSRATVGAPSGTGGHDG